MLAIAALLSPKRALADALDTGGFFLPNQDQYYNPLKHASFSESSTTRSHSRMDNESLLRAAESIRSTSMSAEQRTLNHQWLLQSENQADIRIGSKALSALVKMGLKTYWEGNKSRFSKAEKLVSSDSRRSSYDGGADYKVRVSGSKINFSFQYEF